MKRSLLAAALLVPLILIAPVSARSDERSTPPETLQKALDAVKAKFAPDKRLEYFVANYADDQLSVETTSPDAKNAVLALRDAFPDVEIEAKLLPDDNPELDGKWRAVVKYSTIQIQTDPAYGAEWSTQALMGTPVRVLKIASSGWLLVQNFDGYIGYTTRSSVKRMTEAEFDEWRDAPKIVYTANQGELYETPNPDAAPIGDLVANDVLVWQEKVVANGRYLAQTPDGRRGWANVSEATPREEWLATRELTPENIVAAAKRLLGRPYVWGGTSAKGVDCSGLVNFAFYTNGYHIMRDVSLIQLEGDEVDMSDGWKNFQPGDLLLFGKRRADGSVAWRHVAIYMSDGRFIHSAGSVHYSSLDPADPEYDEGNAKELQKVVRMVGAPETEHFRPIGL